MSRSTYFGQEVAIVGLDDSDRGAWSRGSRLLVLFALACLLVTVSGSLGAVDAFAAQTRLYTGLSFGPDGALGNEAFQSPQNVAVDQSSGDVYVYDADAQKIFRFDSAGEPVNFSSTGTNSIAAPYGNYPSGNAFYQIAIAPPGSPSGTAGDIYFASHYAPDVSVYAPSGVKLGTFGSEFTCGVTTDGTGRVFTQGGEPSAFREYLPSTDPLTDTDLVQSGPDTSVLGACNIATDGNGKFYTASWGGDSFYMLEGISDSSPTKFQPGNQFGGTVAVGQGTGTVFASSQGAVSEYEAGAAGRLGQFGAGQIVGNTHGIAVSATEEQVYVADPGSKKVKVFGPPVPVPTVTLGETQLLNPSEAELRGFVDPEGLDVTECFFEYGTSTSYGQKAPCAALPPSNSEPDPVAAVITGLATDGAQYHFRLVAANANGSEATIDQTLTTEATVVTESPEPVGETTATVRGKVFPDGLQYSECAFEYGLTTHPGFESSVECTPPASGIPANHTFQAVSANLEGLQANNATYRFRLVATNAHGTIEGATLSFSTSGEPELSEVRARDADQHSVTLEGRIDPRGFGTTYQIEWGPTSSYGAIASSGRVAAGETAKRASVEIGGLSPGAIYHYRVVATNRRGTVTSGDREVETVNSCGLPDGRCFELVSSRDAGPVAYAESLSGVEPGFQAAKGPGSVDFMLNLGLPESTRGAEVLYQGARGPGGWSATQVSPPIIARNETSGIRSGSAQIKGLSEDLSCGFVETDQPLTSGASSRLVVEAGGTNFYRRNPDGSYTVVSELPPENLDAVEGSLGSEYVLAGFSQDCAKALFMSSYRYPGVGGVGALRLYEWTEGNLRAVGMVPGPGGEVAVEAIPGSQTGAGQYDSSNTVSSDGSRVFFSAQRQTSSNPAEVGTRGVFVREDGAVTKDLSLSETPTPDKGATYQGATKDGSRVFFTANAGLTPASSIEGTDLYEYDLEEEKLTDLSIEREIGGAQVAGFIGASEDGSHVYFVARGQLVPGAGGTLAENLSRKMYSVYGEEDGEVTYVGAIRQGFPRGGSAEESQLESVIRSGSGFQTSRVSPDGRYLIFESSANITGYESGNGIREVYLYDSDASSEATVCVSCRQDGRESVATFGNRPLPVGANDANPLYEPQSLADPGGKARVFFTSFDALAPGASDGRANLYEWSHGQVFLIATEPPGLQGSSRGNGFTQENLVLAGADPSGTDLYFTTPQTLTWEDGDERSSYYDARVGGGFPEPPPAPRACDAESEGSCQGPPSGGGAAVAGAATAQFSGPGNPKAKHRRNPRRHHRKKKHRKHRHSRKGPERRGQRANGYTNGSGRGSK